MMVSGKYLMIALCLGLACLAAGCSDDCDDAPPARDAFVPNSFEFWNDPDNWTTPYGPAYADVVLSQNNFLPCQGGPIALCYYSGPDPVPCVPTDDGLFTNCRCYEIPYGPYFVLMTAILNYDVYQDTVAVCGSDGSACAGQPNKAPVCDVINTGTLIPGADLISTFSFACVPEEGIGQTQCAASPYVGCMTAPCWDDDDDDGYVTCQCPVFDGPYQIGNFDQQCTLPDDLLWSAAYNPAEGGGTVPQPPTCVPDAPGEIGCPLLDSSTMLPPGTDCAAVCDEYADCVNGGVESGYTCDATLCTASCNDRDLVLRACAGLSNCDTTAILALEQAAGCSCCASQLCGCQPTAATNAELVRLNQAQADRGIESQCAINGTLCGE
jgi:hypothetical protein